MAKLNAKDFIASLNEMSLLEIKELVDAMKEEYGIDPTAGAVAAGPAAAGAEVPGKPAGDGDRLDPEDPAGDGIVPDQHAAGKDRDRRKADR